MKNCISPIRKTHGLSLQLVGLGDVGGTLLTGLVLLGDCIDEIGIYDPDQRRVARYEQELNQVLPVLGHHPRVHGLWQDELFVDCDAFVFTASAGVPPVGSAVKDVRMAQFDKNRAILTPYAKQAVKLGYGGLFFQVSDPVDLLCQVAADAGVPKAQIVGCGLGVMLARANDAATRLGCSDFLQHGRVYGPHGEGLVVANDTGDGYDDALSQRLTQAALTANLSVRETGYKPYIAPALSSGCLTILDALRGNWFFGSTAYDSIFFGSRVRLTKTGVEREPLPNNPILLGRILQTMEALRAWKID